MPSVVGELTKGAVFNKLVDRSNVITAPTNKTSGPYTALVTDYVITCDASGGAFTVNLYASSGNTGRVLEIKKTDSSANAITVDGNASETIDGQTTKTLNYQYSAMKILCDGSNWHII